MEKEDFTAIAVYSDMESTLEFTSSNELLNRFVEATRWSAKIIMPMFQQIVQQEKDMVGQEMRKFFVKLHHFYLTTLHLQGST